MKLYHLEAVMTSCETDSVEVSEAPSEDGKEVVKGRLHTLFALAVAIGRREGLLSQNGNTRIEGGNYVADKGS